MQRVEGSKIKKGGICLLTLTQVW